MEPSQAFDINLPKWPQLYITGPNITMEQAEAVITKTDSFLTSLCSSGGNNHYWNKLMRARTGLLPFSNEMEGGALTYNGGRGQIAVINLGYLIGAAWRREFAVSTCYIGIDRASCAFIGGPHGWCDPSGKIFFDDNVGKWPSVEGIYDDLCIIAKAFPFVTATATIYNEESGSDERLPLVSFRVDAGTVSLLPADSLDVAAHDAYHTPPQIVAPGSGMARIMAQCSRLGGEMAEQGLPEQWVEEFCDSVRAWLPCAILRELEGMRSEDVEYCIPVVTPYFPAGTKFPSGQRSAPDTPLEQG